MDAFEAIILGIIQGLTEWLPVSSSGHLVIAEELLGLPARENLLFDLVVHLGTLVAVCAYFRAELMRIVRSMFTAKASRGPDHEALRMLGFLLLIGTLPAAVVGMLLTDAIENLFDLRLVGFALVANAALLFAAERYGAKGARRSARLLDALIVGTFQAIAVIPGISRSGFTLSGGMFRGLEREIAATFAFLLSVPTLLGAFAYGLVTLERYDADLATFAIGFIGAFLVGLASIEYLLKAVRSGKLWIFSVYCALVGAVVVAATM
ncbi:MAG: undecaprenyl-diphosphate phosphatase [Thermoplasmata archaeon]